MDMGMAAKILTLDPALQKVAVQVAAILPDNLAEALTVLELAKQQVIEFFTSSASP